MAEKVKNHGKKKVMSPTGLETIPGSDDIPDNPAGTDDDILEDITDAQRQKDIKKNKKK